MLHGGTCPFILSLSILEEDLDRTWRCPFILSLGILEEDLDRTCTHTCLSKVMHWRCGSWQYCVSNRVLSKVINSINQTVVDFVFQPTQMAGVSTLFVLMHHSQEADSVLLSQHHVMAWCHVQDLRVPVRPFKVPLYLCHCLAALLYKVEPLMRQLQANSKQQEHFD